MKKSVSVWLSVREGEVVMVGVIPGDFQQTFFSFAFSRKEWFSGINRVYLLPLEREARTPARQRTTEMVNMSFALFRKSVWY